MLSAGGSRTIHVDRDTTVTIEIDDIGGIDRTAVTFEPGCTVLSGQNATNRTSLLKSLAGVLGGSVATLKSDADEGSVRLTIDGRTFERTYHRSDGTVHVDGDPFTDDAVLVDSFVALLEHNPAREAVERGEDLHEVITRPIDTDSIERRIDELARERSIIAEEIDEVERRRGHLDSLVARRESYASQIETITAEIESLQADVAAAEADVDDAADAGDLVDRLEEHQSELTAARNRLEVQRAELRALEEELETLEAQTSESDADLEARLEEVDGTLERHRGTRRSLDETIDSLSTIVSFNRNLLDGGASLPGIEPADRDVTDSLAGEDGREVVCWTCGSTVQRGTIADRLEDLRAVVDEKREERADVVAEVERLESRRRDLAETLETRERRADQREATAAKIEDRRGTIADLEDEIESLEADVAELRERAAETEELRDSDILDAYERIGDLQYERGQLEQQLEDVESEIDEIESLPTVDDLEAERASVADEIASLRDRIDEIEDAAVESFNEHMAAILDVLGYENVARVWIEKKGEVRGGDRTVRFDLHIVRESEGGTMYEDTVETLSESEREVIGLLVGLTGYLVHDVYETVPFILLDSLEAVDAERLSKLIDYFQDYAPFLVVALLTEDANAVDGDFPTITADALES